MQAFYGLKGTKAGRAAFVNARTMCSFVFVCVLLYSFICQYAQGNVLIFPCLSLCVFMRVNVRICLRLFANGAALGFRTMGGSDGVAMAGQGDTAR